MKHAIYMTFLLGFVGIHATGQTTPITGDLTVSGSLKAGTASPDINAEFRENGIFLLRGTSGVGGMLSTDQTEGAKLIWHPGKSAFRAGTGYGNLWSDASIGAYSAAFGENARASGLYSFATGQNVSASGDSSVAYGCVTSAIGFAAMAGGWGTAAEDCALAWGEYSYAGGYASVAVGLRTIASGHASSAFGFSTQANSRSSFAIGENNIGGGHSYNWQESDPLFEIGNGSDYSNRSNAMTVYKNGDVDVDGKMQVQGVVICAPGGDIPMFTGN